MDSEIPFLYVEAAAFGNTKTPWGKFYKDALRNAGEILIDKKHANTEDESGFSIVPSRYDSIESGRDALCSAIKHRKIRVLAIDEAVHLLRFGNYDSIMDTLKSLANETGAKIVLLGPYQLFGLITQYDQVARRGEVIHFQRYHTDSSTDRAEFQRMVTKLQSLWPCEQVPQFSAIHGPLMEASLGMIGLLKDILLRSLKMQLDNGGVWDPRLLQRAAKSKSQLHVIRSAYLVGEELVKGGTYGESIFTGDQLEQAIALCGAVEA